MPFDNEHAPMTELDVLVGTWTMEARFVGEPPRAETTFEWLGDGQFLIQRWLVDHPDAPDGIAIIGAGAEPGSYLQHYFDSRGVERVYEMTLAGREWTLARAGGDFSQRFVGTVSEDGDTIIGHWAIAEDGATWRRDFDLTYTRVAS
jgi:hypothetical protein